MSKKNVLYFQTPSLQIKNIKLAPFHIDGEPQTTATHFEIVVLKNCFKLIQMPYSEAVLN
jgi:diacylglycerol kinase family enzyme